MTAKVIRMVNSKEGEQTQRFRWREAQNGYYVWDSQPLQTIGETIAFKNCVGMGDGVDMFCDDEDGDCLTPGTQRFYDALNGYFECEQTEIAMAYFGIEYKEEDRANG